MTEIAERAIPLCQIARLFSTRQWCLATSGNFSVRTHDGRCLITETGKDKSRLTEDDLMVCDLNGKAVATDRTPSAETALHCCLYRLDDEIGAVFHTHSATATVLSRHADANLYFEHYEMQKALGGVKSHSSQVNLVVLDNSQQMSVIVSDFMERWDAGEVTVPGFLIRGHGLYAWGRDMFEAQRHVEGLEFLMTCAWQERLATQ